MRFILLDEWREVRPFALRAQKDVPYLVAVGADPRGIVERTGRQGAHARHRLQGETEVAAASAAELEVEPSTRFIRDMPVARDALSCDLDLVTVEHGLGAEGRAGTTLAPGAMADRDARRLGGRLESHGAAHAAARPLSHCEPSGSDGYP